MTTSKWLIFALFISIFSVTTGWADKSNSANSQDGFGQDVSGDAKNIDKTKDSSFGKKVSAKAKSSANSFGMDKADENRPDRPERPAIPERPESPERPEIPSGR